MPPTLTPDRTETLAPRQASTAPTVAPPAAQPLDDDPSPPAADDPDRYEQVQEHARGGLGRVVRAVDRRLGRTVAVKELLRHDPANEARFLREAMITARLEHPGIVPVHEAGRWANGDPYYVMKLVEGRTLKELIVEHTALRDRIGLLAHVVAVADAVGYAHSEGVIHRDLKPSNVVVGEFGETIVVDWGLACDRRHDTGAPAEPCTAAAGSGVSTVSGKVVGTPAYMSPEQARGEPVDERADVYALGAVLYEVLAGTPPHSDATPQAVLERVIAGPPRPLSMVVPSVPGELATIVRKAMARDPEARYPNAGALAEDLRRFTTGKLVSAHSYTTWALLRRRLARHRGVVAVALASLLVLAAVGAASVRRVVAERNIARNQRELAEEALTSAEKRKRELVLLQAETALAKDPTAALAWLKSYDVRSDDMVKVVDVIDEAMSLGVARHVFRPGDWVLDAQFTPDGSSVVAMVRDGMIRLYDVATGGETEIGRAPSDPMALAISPDGETVITGGQLGEVIAWPLHGGAPRELIERSGRQVEALRIVGDRVLVDRVASAPRVVPLAGGEPELLAPTAGRRYAVADSDWSRVVMVTSANEVVVTQRGQPPRVLAHSDRMIDSVELSPCGDTVLIHDGLALSVVPYDGGEPRELMRYDQKIRSVAWAPDGKTAVIGGEGTEIVVLDTVSGAHSELRGHSDVIYTVELSRDGSLLLSASDDGTARLWRLADHSSIVLRGHDDDVVHARFSPDERSVVTASLDGSVRIWPIGSARQTQYSEGAPVADLQVDGDSAIASTASEIDRWDLVTGQHEQLFEADAAHRLGVGMASSDGERVVVPNSDGSLSLYHRGQLAATLRGHRGMITHIELSRDGKTIYSSSADGSLRRWNAETGAGSVLLAGDIPVRGFAVARDGRIAAQAGELAYLIDPAGAVRLLGKGNTWCVAYAGFEPVTDRLVIHRCDMTLAVVDPDRVIELSTDGRQASRITISPDGRWFAAGISDRTVRLWDASSGQVIGVLRGHSDFVLDVAFSPDGRQLASASWDKTIGVWDLATKRHRVLRGHTAPVGRVAWRDAEHLVTSSPDGTIRLWDAPSLALPSAADIADQLSAATSAQIDHDRPSSERPAARRT